MLVLPKHHQQLLVFTVRPHVHRSVHMKVPVGAGRRLAQALHNGGGRKHAEAELRCDNGATVEIAARRAHTATERIEGGLRLKGGRHAGQRGWRFNELALNDVIAVLSQCVIEPFQWDHFGDLGISVKPRP